MNGSSFIGGAVRVATEQVVMSSKLLGFMGG